MSIQDVRDEIVEMRDAYTDAIDENKESAIAYLIEGNINAYIGATAELMLLIGVNKNINILLDKFDEEFSHSC